MKLICNFLFKLDDKLFSFGFNQCGQTGKESWNEIQDSILELEIVSKISKIYANGCVSFVLT